MKRAQILSNARFAGSVLRYHTWPTIQRQTVADHTWHVLRIWFQIWGPLSPAVSSHLLWHDAGELVLGDLPFPVKGNNPRLKHECEVVEEKAVTDMGGAPNGLLGYNKVRAKACDLVEMWEFGWMEAQLGNRFAQPIMADISKALSALPLTTEDKLLVSKYISKWEEELWK
jgi:hypothetical protein